eukprot:TRINITY_DN113629_c0_g1_i1.p1 TRINITY_DN113629_c0_g1~~TRINITY_DN113629_c0_g1_i1.p1  ORF type:complete len:346 (-),score=26.48 TRINITY_DN113629_c0_g1_i1:7-1044(-)
MPKALWIAVLQQLRHVAVFATLPDDLDSSGSSHDAHYQAVSMLQRRQESGLREHTRQQEPASRLARRKAELLEELAEVDARMMSNATHGATVELRGDGCCPMPSGVRLGCCDSGGCCPTSDGARMECCGESSGLGPPVPAPANANGYGPPAPGAGPPAPTPASGGGPPAPVPSNYNGDFSTPASCGRDTGESCLFFECGSGALCQNRRCVCQDGMCAQNKRCVIPAGSPGPPAPLPAPPGCVRNTGGTCMVFGCDVSRGAECHQHQCMCPDGFCMRNGQCVAGTNIQADAACTNPGFPFADEKSRVCYNKRAYAQQKSGPCHSWCYYGKALDFLLQLSCWDAKKC